MAFYQDNQPLFLSGDLGAELRKRLDGVSAAVDRVPQEQFVGTSDEVLVEHLFASMEIEPIELHEDKIVMETAETSVDVTRDPNRNWWRDDYDRGPLIVPGMQAAISIPYTGFTWLWKCRPSTFRSTVPRANVLPATANTPGSLQIVLALPHDEGEEKYQRLLKEQLDGIRFYIDSQRRDLDDYHRKLRNMIPAAIEHRRNRLGKFEGIIKSLNIPLKRKEGAPDVEPIKVQRKLVRPLPAPPKSGYKPEPGIADEVYKHILSVIRHEGRTFETTPQTYAVHGEEELRDIMLAHLNGHYEGGATGETFRKTGKTDIRIMEGDRAAFVAECKLWSGVKKLHEAVDQLVDYLTWRDCKAALVIFNKKVAAFSDLLVKVPEALAQHPNCVEQLGQSENGEWSFVFRSAEDEARRISVQVFLFDLHV